MGKHFWLMQTGSFSRDLKAATDLLGSASGFLIRPDYMGSAEFGWGAIPRAYRRIMGQYEQYHLHVTDLTTVNGVPFCLYCRDGSYERILNEIKAYLDEPYRTKERTNLEVHFTTKNPFEADIRKVQLRTNCWWCIDIARSDEDVGDWIAFTGATDRQNAFKRVFESDFANWWSKMPIEDRTLEYRMAFER